MTWLVNFYFNLYPGHNWGQNLGYDPGQKDLYMTWVESTRVNLTRVRPPPQQFYSQQIETKHAWQEKEQQHKNGGNFRLFGTLMF